MILGQFLFYGLIASLVFIFQISFLMAHLSFFSMTNEP
jgi:hypothetical protein